jgi:hypothetical protein
VRLASEDGTAGIGEGWSEQAEIGAFFNQWCTASAWLLGQAGDDIGAIHAALSSMPSRPERLATAGIVLTNDAITAKTAIIRLLEGHHRLPRGQQLLQHGPLPRGFTRQEHTDPVRLVRLKEDRILRPSPAPSSSSAMATKTTARCTGSTPRTMISTTLSCRSASATGSNSCSRNSLRRSPAWVGQQLAHPPALACRAVAAPLSVFEVRSHGGI